MKNIQRQVQRILDRVEKDGDRAVSYYLKKFDGLRLEPSSFMVGPDAFDAAQESLGDELKDALRIAAKNIAAFYTKEKKVLLRDWVLRGRGRTVGQRWAPIDAVGIYVPGGKYSYPSTVLMAGIPALIAGVKRIVIISPPGRISPAVLTAARIAGVHEFYRIGGPAGIAALAFGTKTIQPVDKIVGPGNIYVTTAKRLLYGRVGLDLVAGPSEIVIVADDPADAELIMQDIRAQEEHDADARGIVISMDKRLTARLRGLSPRTRVIMAGNVREAAEELNRIAPEHVQLITRNNKELIKRIRCAGTVCVGRNTPAAIGDYTAGPSHILPTGKSARFSSGLSIIDFCTRVNIIRYDGASTDFTHAVRIAGSEGMGEHAASLKRRIDSW